MAFPITTNVGKTEIAKGINMDTDTFKVILLVTNALAAQEEAIKDCDTVTALLALCPECTATGYTNGFGGAGRKSVDLTMVVDDTNNASYATAAADPTWNPLGNATNQQILGAALIKENTNDGDSIPIVVWDITDTNTNGSQFTLQIQTMDTHARTVLKLGE